MNHQPQTNRYPEARFWDRIANRYSQKPVPDQQVYQTKLTKTSRYLKPSDHVLEIGCGTGTTALHHAPMVAHICATDISRNMIEIANTKARQANITNVEFKVPSIDSLTEAAESFDVILAHSILHLLPTPQKVLERLNQMLKPDGVLISSTVCISDFMPLLEYVVPLGRAVGLMPYVNIFSEREFKQWLADAGFVIEESWQPRPKSGIYIVARKAGEG